METIQEILKNVKLIRSKNNATTKIENLHDMKELILALILKNISIKSQLKYIENNLNFKVSNTTYRKFLNETFPEEYKVFKMSKNIDFLEKNSIPVNSENETKTDILNKEISELTNNKKAKRIKIIKEVKNLIQKPINLNKEENINKPKEKTQKKENILQMILMTFIIIVFTILFSLWVASETIEKDFEKKLTTLAFENNFYEYNFIDCEMDIYGTKACHAEIKFNPDSKLNQLSVITYINGHEVWYLK